MYICFDCHREFDEPDMKYGFGGYPEEPTWHCPYCDSMDFDEADECAECGAVKFVDNLTYGYCEDCLKEAASDARTAYEYGGDYPFEIELNSTFSGLSRFEIEAILMNHFMCNGDLGKMAKDNALDNDICEFAYWLKKRRDKNESGTNAH
jgi:hypothetical protein